MLEYLLILVCGLSVGLALGLTGSGGSLFAIPLLVYVIGLNMASAVPVSLLVVAGTALIGAISAMRRQMLQVRPTLIFGIAGMATSGLGLWLGTLVDEPIRVAAFALLAILMSLRMAWQSRNRESTTIVRAGLSWGDQGGVCRYAPEGGMRFTLPCAFALFFSGGLTGILSGFFGVGGGFLIVPVLMFIIRMDMAHAVASSLAIIAMIGLSGGLVAGLPLIAAEPKLLLFALGSLLGMGLGRQLSRILAGVSLQRLFAAALLLTGLVMLIRTLRS